MEDKAKLKNEILDLLEEVTDYCQYESVYDKDIIECLFKIKNKITPFIQADRKSLEQPSINKDQTKTDFKESKIESRDYLSRFYRYKSLNKHGNVKNVSDENTEAEKVEISNEDNLLTELKQEETEKTLKSHDNHSIMPSKEAEGTSDKKEDQNKDKEETKHVNFRIDACIEELDEINTNESAMTSKELFRKEKSKGIIERESSATNGDFFKDQNIQQNEARNNYRKNFELKKINILEELIDKGREIETNEMSKVKIPKAPFQNQYRKNQTPAVQKSKLFPPENFSTKLKPACMDSFPLSCWQNVVEELEEALKKKRSALSSNVAEIELNNCTPSENRAAAKTSNSEVKLIIAKGLPASSAEAVITQLKEIFKMRKKPDEQNGCEDIALQNKDPQSSKTQFFKERDTKVVSEKTIKLEPLKDAFWLVIQELQERLKEKQEVELRQKPNMLSPNRNMPELRLSVIDVLESFEKDNGINGMP